MKVCYTNIKRHLACAKNRQQREVTDMNQAKWKLMRDLFLTFLKISPLTFGGGYAMLAMIEREVTSKRKWMDGAEMNDTFTAASAIPGAIAINTAALVGSRLAGMAGAMAATIGMLLPTVMIVLLLGIAFLYVQDHPLVASAFTSIRATVVALIVYAAYRFGRAVVWNKTSFALCLVTVVMLYNFQLHPIFIIAGSSAVGLLLVYKKVRRNPQASQVNGDPSSQQAPDFYMGEGI